MTYENYKTFVSSRILARSVKRENGCIEYCGDKPLKHKYGLVSITIDGKRKSIPSSRAMYMALNDCFDLPRNVVIRHSCDNPRCVNREHLLRGTHKDNSRDMLERDRQRRPETYQLHTRQRIHSDETIRAIRSEPDSVKNKQIAYKYGVSNGYVSKIRLMKAKTLVI